MKKIIALLLALLLFASLFSCHGDNTNNKVTPDGALAQTDDVENPDSPLVYKNFDFHKYLEQIGLNEKIHFLDKVESYKYNGKGLAEQTMGCYYDGFDGGGYEASSDLFGYRSDLTVNDAEEIGILTDEIYTSVELEGLDMPAEITFGDTLNDVLARLDIKVDMQSFGPDKSSVIVRSNESSSLELIDCQLKGTSTKPYYSLKYEEHYTSVDSIDRELSVTRTFSMGFGGDDYRLNSIFISIVAEYDTNPNNEIFSLSECLTINEKDAILMLPVSRKEIAISNDSSEFYYLEYINFDLLKSGEQKIINECSEYPIEPKFYLSFEDNALYLCAEILFNSVTDSENNDGGEGIDHEYKLFKECITDNYS